MTQDRFEYEPGGAIDDMVMTGTVHLERLNNGYFLHVWNSERDVLIDLRSATGRAVVRATVREAATSDYVRRHAT